MTDTARVALSSVAAFDSDDARCLDAWLRLKAARTPSTLEAYHRAARRLLTWCAERGLRVGALTERDASAYLAHLARPPSHWLRPRGASRTALRPTQLLYGALAPTSLSQERVLLVTLYADLGQMGELRCNPFKLTVTPAAEQESVADKALTQQALQALQTWIESQPSTPALERWRWVSSLLYHTGVRRIEARFASMADFRFSDEGWQLRIVGKRKKVRWVTVSQKLVAALERYRRQQGLSPLPSPHEHDIPVIMPLKGPPRFLSARAFNLMIEALLAQCLPALDNPHLRRELEALTPHRFRHTNATHRLAKGARLETTQDELGHADPRTTRLYAKTARARRTRDADLL